MGLTMMEAGALDRLRATALDATIERVTGKPADPDAPNRSGSVDDIVALLLAKPWRRSSADDATRADIHDKVRGAVEADRPIEFAVPFGGYKGWQLAAFPHPDWAELFWIDYLRRYAERIVAVHAPGAVISFSHTSGVLEWINNLPAGAQATYIESFGRLLTHRSSSRLQLRLEDHADAYGGPLAVLRLLESRLEFAPRPGPADLASARRNMVQRSRDQGPDGLSDAEVEDAARRCLTMMSLEQRRSFNKYGPRIQITHVRGGSLSLHLGSCRSATAQPWVSSGYLEWHLPSESWVERLETGGTRIAGLHSIAVDHQLRGLSPPLSQIAIALPSSIQ